MIWELSHRSYPAARVLADRHYSRQSVGATGFVPPGRCVVLLSTCRRAYWTTSWPFAEYTKHDWAGAWVNSAFRSEGAGVASEMIVQAVAATRHIWPTPPDLGMITFIDTAKVKPTYRRGKPTWGYCYIKAGFEEVGYTRGGLLALQLTVERMPKPEPAIGCHVGGLVTPQRGDIRTTDNQNFSIARKPSTGKDLSACTDQMSMF